MDCLSSRNSAVWLAGGLIGAAMLLMLAADCPAQSFSIPEPNTVMDQAGRKIVVTRPFHRIISLYGAHTENLFALGVGDRLVGVSPHESYPKEALGKPSFSYHDGAEKFLAAEPDLILIRPMIDRAYGSLFAQLERLGITVASVQPKTVSEMFTYWRILGMLTGTRERAEQLVARFQQTVAQYRDAAASMPRKKKVYFESIHSKMKTFSPQSMAVFALTTAGGINIAADAKTVSGTNIADYGKERILSHGPEIDVYLAQVGPMNRPTIELIRNEPGFQTIRAVRTGNVFLIDEQLVSRPTIRLLEGIRTIAGILRD